MNGDLRSAWRSLRNHPLSSAVIVALLALGIGANTVLFSVVDALLLRPLPVARPEELVQFFSYTGTLRYPEYEDAYCEKLLRQRPASLSDVACEASLFVAVSSNKRTERREVGVVSDNYYSMLGVQPQLGRLPETNSAMLSYGFWRDAFAGDPRALGQTIFISGHPFVIAGVDPEGFNGTEADTGPDVRITRAGEQTITPRDGDAQSRVFGRLRPGSSATSALQEAQGIALEGQLPKPDPNHRETLESIQNGSSTLRSQFGTALTLLMAGVFGLLLIVCANVAGLLVARAALRSRELAVRVAIGATRWQLIRQVVTECAALVAAGGVLGVTLAYAAMPLVLRALPPIRDRAAYMHPLRLTISPDLRVLAFTFAVCALTALLFSIAPAVASAGVDVHAALKSMRSSLSISRSRAILVSVQVALCTILLLGAGLLVRTLATLQTLPPGFAAEHVVTFSLDPSMAQLSHEAGQSLKVRLLEKVTALPGVPSAAFAGRALMRGTGLKSTIAPEGALTPPGGPLNTSINPVDPNYFETMQIPLLAGRTFREDETIDLKPAPVIVNQAFARAFFPKVDPIGKRFGAQGQPATVIIGVVGDAKYRSLREPTPPIFYPRLPADGQGGTLYVRTSGDPEALIPAVERTLRELEPRLPFFEVHTLTEEIHASLWQDRLVAWLASLFGGTAALLAGVGLYGMLSYAVTGRRREIGIRMALGAEPSQVSRLVSMQALAPVGAGIALGLLGFAGTARWIAALLFGVNTWDGLALAATVAAVAAVSLIAISVPAWQAVHVDPSETLRDET
jgi:predicted permease